MRSFRALRGVGAAAFVVVLLGVLAPAAGASYAPAGTVTEFSAGITPGSAPGDIAAGPDGNLWFTEAYGNRIGRITPAGTITEFSAGISGNSTPQGIAAGSDGNLWFTETYLSRIGRISAGVAWARAQKARPDPKGQQARPERPVRPGPKGKKAPKVWASSAVLENRNRARVSPATSTSTQRPTCSTGQSKPPRRAARLR